MTNICLNIRRTIPDKINFGVKLKNLLYKQDNKDQYLCNVHPLKI